MPHDIISIGTQWWTYDSNARTFGTHIVVIKENVCDVELTYYYLCDPRSFLDMAPSSMSEMRELNNLFCDDEIRTPLTTHV